MKKSMYDTKIFLLMGTALSSLFLLLSCTDDTDTLPQSNDRLVAYRKAATGPSNAINPYDYAGQIHNELLSSCYALPKWPASNFAILMRVDSLAHTNVRFSSIASPRYQLPDIQKLEFILQNGTSSATSTVNGTGLSIAARTSLSNFISAMVAFSDTAEEYGVVHDFVVDYETEVLARQQFDARDKKILLTVSSIARHSSYAKKKRPKKNLDPDWDILVGNIIAAVGGAANTEAAAIVFGLAAGMAQNPQ